MIKRIVVISDIHSGHIKGLNPSYAISENQYNPFQDFVRDSFNDFVKKYYNPDYLVLNGDICDGTQDLAKGVEALATSTDEQVKFAVDIIKPIIGKKTEVHGVKGSGYHNADRNGSNLDRQVIEKLGGTYHGNIFELAFDNEKIQFKHDGGFTTATIEKEMKNIIEDSVKSKTKPPTMIVRSHGHSYLSITKASISSNITPCWQYMTDFMEKKAFKYTPDIGGLIIEYDTTSQILYSYAKLYPIPSEIHDKMRSLHKMTISSRDRKKSDYDEYCNMMKRKMV